MVEGGKCIQRNRCDDISSKEVCDKNTRCSWDSSRKFCDDSLHSIMHLLRLSDRIEGDLRGANTCRGKDKPDCGQSSDLCAWNSSTKTCVEKPTIMHDIVEKNVRLRHRDTRHLLGGGHPDTDPEALVHLYRKLRRVAHRALKAYNTIGAMSPHMLYTDPYQAALRLDKSCAMSSDAQARWQLHDSHLYL
eukprot:g6393.t1